MLTSLKLSSCVSWDFDVSMLCMLIINYPAPHLLLKIIAEAFDAFVSPLIVRLIIHARLLKCCFKVSDKIIVISLFHAWLCANLGSFCVVHTCYDRTTRVDCSPKPWAKKLKSYEGNFIVVCRAETLIVRKINKKSSKYKTVDIGGKLSHIVEEPDKRVFVQDYLTFWKTEKQCGTCLHLLFSWIFLTGFGQSPFLKVNKIKSEMCLKRT